MVAADLRRTGAALLAAAALAACAGRPQPKPMPPQTVTKATPEPPPPSEPPVAAPAPTRNEPIVIDAGEQSEEPTTTAAVVEAARRERERRRTAPPPAIVLDNKSLAKYAGGQLTVASPAAGQSPEAAAADQQAEREKYWRERALEVRQRWRQAYDSIAVHEQEAAELRTRFYATDDPYVRDGQVKPAWDRALDLLAQAKRDAQAAEEAVADTLEEGRRAGALPGWLREGLDLEPAPPPPPKPANEPGEPPVLQEAPRDPNDPP